MAFTGKATYSAGSSLPELAEDVCDIIGIVSPYETPFLDALGDPLREARSTHHEWLEDELLPNKDVIVGSSISDPAGDTVFDVANGGRFRAGDQIQVEGSSELMLVSGVDGDNVTVVRGYAGTSAEDMAAGQVINILGNAALEGSSRPDSRFTNRRRMGNYTQIFTAAVEVSGSDLAANQIGLADEMDYQKQERLRELIRDLENTVINGGGGVNSPQGSGVVRRSMRGIIQHLESNQFVAGQGGFGSGDDLDESKLNYALRRIWQISNGSIDLIVVGGSQKRRINGFLDGSRYVSADEVRYRNLVSVYESDFGVCRVVTSRWIPQDCVLLLDSSRIKVIPLSGRSFHFKPLASNGDYECGELIGEYTLELKNESAHGIIRGLSVV